MSFIELLFLSILQGFTEFLPISSSGHLLLAERIFGIKETENTLLFSLVLHLGTVTAIAISFRSTIAKLSKRKIKTLLLALLPLFFLLPVMGFIKTFMQTTSSIGIGFIAGGCWILFAERSTQQRKCTLSPFSYRTAIWIGTAQAFAIFPGISRLGTTTGAALFLNSCRTEAVTFSLLLAIPTVLGGVFLETRVLFYTSPNSLSIPLSYFFLGYIISCLTGLTAIRLLLWISRVATFRIFGYYCISMGIVTLIAIL